MINANELRIGNLVSHNGNWSYRSNSNSGTIIQWNERDWFALGESTMDLEDISPIPLTEEWLLKFGFEEESPDNKNTFGRRWKINNTLEIVPTSNPYSVFVINNDNDESAKVIAEIKSVHQLQNLYFALTGEELTLNHG